MKTEAEIREAATALEQMAGAYNKETGERLPDTTIFMMLYAAELLAWVLDEAKQDAPTIPIDYTIKEWRSVCKKQTQ